MFERIRAAWRAFWSATTATTMPVPVKPDMRISPAAIWEANKQGARKFMPGETFRPLTPLAGVVPGGMALDSSLSNVDVLASYALEQLNHEGLGFLGYPYLAELSQRAEYRNVVSIWAEYCTKKWIKLSGDDAKVKELQTELDRLEVRDIFQEAIALEGFFGRIQLFMDFGDWDRPEELATPLAVDPRKIGKTRPLKRLTIVEPMWSYPGVYSAQNPLAPDFYRPATWYLSGRTVHASRMLTLVSNPMPNMLKPAYAFGGVARTQQIKAYVDNWLRSRQSASDLLHAFSVMVLKTDMESVLGGGAGEALWARVDLFNKTRDNRGTFVVDKDAEDFTNVAAPIAGLDKMVAQALEQISAISGIPISILLGQTPSGLNASSDGEIRIFYDRILSWLDTNVRPLLTVLLDVVQLSLWGKIDEEITFEFEALWEMSDKDKADIRKSDAEADTAYINAGVVDAEEVRDRLRNDETSLYHGVDLSGPAPDLPDDAEGEQGLPFGSDANWNEGDHPRDERGRFGSGGGVSNHASHAEFAGEAHTTQSKQDRHLGQAFRNVPDDLHGYHRVMNAQEVRKNLNSHGIPHPRFAEQPVITPEDFNHVDTIVEQGERRRLGAPGSRKPERLEYRAIVDGKEYVYTEIIGHTKKRLGLLSFYRKR